MSEKGKLCQNEKGLELSGIDWLVDHHKTKEDERREMVGDMSLKEGETVLDLACGPGLWTSLIAEKVSPGGKVVGVDFSPDLIEHARESFERKQECIKNVVEFRIGDLYDIPFEDDSFDVVLCGNTYAYITEPLEALEEQRRVTKRGGKVVAKDFDNGNIIFHPIEASFSQKIMEAAARSLKENPPEPKFDNYIGRKMYGLFLKAGFKDVYCKSYAISKVAPLSPASKRYISGTAEWYARIAEPYLSKCDVQRWREYFDSDSDNYILEREEFYLCMVAMLTIGVV